jgi:hypothetical protein
MLSVAIIALAAHVFGDFLLQTSAIAMGKRRLGWLLLHSLIHGALVYVCLQQWTAWELPAAIAVVHGAIDAVKVRVRRSAATFGWDQVAHVISVLLLAALAVQQGWVAPFSGLGWHGMVLFAGFCATVTGVGYFVGEVADRMFAENPSLQQMRLDGLKDGGKRIGQLERALIFVMIIAGEPTGIGFLIGAKSILRFEEAKKQHVAEYVLIGTLWSFGLAIVLSWLTSRGLALGTTT